MGRAAWTSRPIFLGKMNLRVESPQSDHDFTPERFLPPFCQRTLETRSQEDFLDRRLQEMNRRIESGGLQGESTESASQEDSIAFARVIGSLGSMVAPPTGSTDSLKDFESQSSQ